jgi:hypothetical protein
MKVYFERDYRLLWNGSTEWASTADWNFEIDLLKASWQFANSEKV